MALSSPSAPDAGANGGPAPPVEVLIVDNDRAHADAVAESLGRIGFHCRVAASGSDGARIIEEQDFDVIITDLVMHDVDGLGILARARTPSPTPRSSC